MKSFNNEIYTSNTFVGIGITRPSYNLHVSGSTFTTGQIAASNLKIYNYSQSNILSFNNSIFTLDARGNLGIGITNPQYKLHVVNNSNIDTFRINNNILITNRGNIGIGTTISNALLHIHTHSIIPGMIVQTTFMQTSAQTVTAIATSGDGTIISDLNISITAKTNTGKFYVKWMVHGEIHWDSVFRIYKNNVLVGYNTIQGIQQWSGAAAVAYDNDTISTQSNYIIQWIDEAAKTIGTTYTFSVGLITNAASRNFTLNRTTSSAGTGAYEAAMSGAIAYEIA
jgi:hypothetical protein